MTPNIPLAVRNLIEEYRSFLRTTYRFLDPHLRKQFEEHLERAYVVVKGPYVTLARDFALGPTLEELVRMGEAHPGLLQVRWPFGKGRLFAHQERALQIGRAGRSFVVTTGTGSGKTEAFLLPMLDGILRRKAGGVEGLQAIIVYPMNALAHDQLERLRRLLRGTGLNISFGLYTGESDSASLALREEPAETERLSRAAIRENPPDVLLTNYKQLDFLLVRRDDRRMFQPSLRYLVLDELHSYRGALATEIACLLRRLKAQSGLGSGDLVAIGTSATVASESDGLKALAQFASTLFGEEVRPEDIVAESYVRRVEAEEEYAPPLADLAEAALLELDPNDEQKVVALAEALTGRSCPAEGAVANRVGAVLAGNKVVRALEEFFTEPRTVAEAVEHLRETLPERKDADPERVRREIEAYLLVGSVGDEEHPPRLRPKLHTFFHGVYDVGLCLNPECRTLVPHGGAECPRCGSVAHPAALCRTCGQDFVKVRFAGEDDDRPIGTSDFFSGEYTGFLTHEIRELDEGPGTFDEEDEERAEAERAQERERRDRRQKKAEGRLSEVGVCIGCGRLVPQPGATCPSCNRATVRMLLHRGTLNTCPACGDSYTRADIVTPLHTGTASTVSVLATHHLDHLQGEDRKLLVFTDNRQDAAHQAGYTKDKHRVFALRHVLAYELREAGADGLYLTELPQRLFDRFLQIGLISRRPSRPEQRRWLDALTYQVANELTRYSRQRASLENLGLVAVEYEGLEELSEDGQFLAAAQNAGLQPDTALNLVRAVLDVMRKNRAVAYDGRPETGTDLAFFTEYIDPSTKHRYRELEGEPYAVRFPDRDRAPKAFALDRPDHIRNSGRLMGFVQENPRAGQLTATHKLVARLVGGREPAEAFLRAVVPLLVEYEVLVSVRFPIPAREQVRGLQALQVDPRRIRLRFTKEGYRCNACQTWRAYELPTCPTPKCQTGCLVPMLLDRENYYVRLYLERSPGRLKIAEHSAQIGEEERTRRETDFKEGSLDALVCTPTLELGVDIGPLLTVVLRNAPPTPANYAQRVGRAGRRLRIGFVSTFCSGGTHDRHAFLRPEWFVSGRFEPPRLRLDNPQIVFRHLRAYLLSRLDAQLPSLLKELLDDVQHPSRWRRETLDQLFGEVHSRRDELVEELLKVMARDRDMGLVGRYGREDITAVVDGFQNELIAVLERWWHRVEQLDREFREFSKIGSPRQDQRKADARQRAYYEITQDPERAYTLNYLSTQQLLPAYQFPVETFSLDPGVDDTPTIYRAAAIAIEEFAPGNFVYANGHKLRSIRVLYPGGPGAAAMQSARSDAEAAGRLQAFHFCEECDEVVESGRNSCPRCAAPLGSATDVVFVDAFEAEESFRITSEEESRQRQFFDRREALLAQSAVMCRVYPYALHPVELLKLAEILVTNWGPLDRKTGEGRRFWLCPDCGRHLPHNPEDKTHERQVRQWREDHARFCRGELVQLVLAHRFQADCLILNLPGREGAASIGRRILPQTAVTLAEALRAGAGRLLELELDELGVFVRRPLAGSGTEQIVFYETVPGGAGYLEEMAARLPEVAQEAQRVLYDHDCSRACYGCLKHYRNQRWHSLFNKDLVRDVLVAMANLDHVQPETANHGAGAERLKQMIDARSSDSDTTFSRYPKGVIEEPLRAALERLGVTDGDRDFEVRDEQGRIVTVPDFAWPDAKVAVYCDSYAYHGNPDILELDAKKRNYLQLKGWGVLAFWGQTILRDADGCARQVVELLKARRPSVLRTED
ncbi:DEAD/DEAH box helicase [Chthonomonas calidirosea]|uniref:DEAD/DEAH box helicase n=1 Tax=Chthonomonas calidirosea TaxID=454171 RepID=UPI0006EC7D90|nr:DEAD/DEAH box helicase [Chthonomonas calidirosea]CEK13074.1 helicase family protein with metal-binding cysteine cluster [Chthonomonas calidirosea]